MLHTQNFIVLQLQCFFHKRISHNYYELPEMRDALNYKGRQEKKNALDSSILMP